MRNRPPATTIGSLSKRTGCNIETIRYCERIGLLPAPGHTPDHVAINFASRGQRAVMCGDIMHSPVQLAEPHWEPWPDFDAKAATRTRRAFLEQHCDTLVCTAHFPLPSAGRVVRAGDAFRMVMDVGGW